MVGLSFIQAACSKLYFLFVFLGGTTVQGILSSVYLDGQILHGWKMIPIPFHNLNQVPTLSFEIQLTKKRSEKFDLTNGQCSVFFPLIPLAKLRTPVMEISGVET